MFEFFQNSTSPHFMAFQNATRPELRWFFLYFYVIYCYSLVWRCTQHLLTFSDLLLTWSQLCYHVVTVIFFFRVVFPPNSVSWDFCNCVKCIIEHVPSNKEVFINRKMFYSIILETYPGIGFSKLDKSWTCRVLKDSRSFTPLWGNYKLDKNYELTCADSHMYKQ